MTIEDLEPFLDSAVTLRMTKGEVAKVKVLFVDEEYADIIVYVLETSQSNQYTDLSGALTFAAADIACVVTGR